MTVVAAKTWAAIGYQLHLPKIGVDLKHGIPNVDTLGATCFAPEQDCATLATGAIHAAQHEILVSAYVLTNGSGIPGALTCAYDRGLTCGLSAIALNSVGHKRRPKIAGDHHKFALHF